MTKILVKTRLPMKAWAVAALVTLFSMVSTFMHAPTIPGGSTPNVAQATLAPADNIVTGAIR
jgi:hypothetical protein